MPAHGGRARLGLVGLRALLADVLADLERAQPLDHPGPEHQHQEQRRQARHRGAERDVADDVQARDLVAEAPRAGGRASAPHRPRLSEARRRSASTTRLHADAARALHEHRVARRAPGRRRRPRPRPRRGSGASESGRPPARAPSRKSAASGPTPDQDVDAAPRRARPVCAVQLGGRVGPSSSMSPEEAPRAGARPAMPRAATAASHGHRVRVVAVVEQRDALARRSTSPRWGAA